MNLKQKEFTGNANSEYDIEIFNLSKNYSLQRGKKIITALAGVNLKIKKGEIFGLLGPNGAGKTTLVSILTTLIQPNKGYATILGRNVLKEPWFIRENVGLMLGGEMIYLRLTGYRNLKFFCKLYGIKNYKAKINELAEMFDLTNWLQEYVSKYSKGMKLKLALARVLLIDPKVLFLDEPMLGLDPVSVQEVIEILKNLKKTIFLTSHQMGIVSKLCDRIAFLNKGKILKIDTQENFKKLIAEKIKIEIEVVNKKNELIEDLNKQGFIIDVGDNHEKITVLLNNEQDLQKLLKILGKYPIIHINELKPTLSDVFIKLSEDN